MRPEPVSTSPLDLGDVRRRVDAVVLSYLGRTEAELGSIHPAAAVLGSELRRLVEAGGKRLRPLLCYLGYRAAGEPDGPEIIRAAAALELFHTFAIVHDDVMDEDEERRGVPSTPARFIRELEASAPPGEVVRLGRAVAVLVGDVAAVLSERLLLASGFPPGRLGVALARFDDMRLRTAAGQFLDLGGAGARDEILARRIAALKTGAYTVEGPLQIGAALAGAPPALEAALARFAEPLGEAFQVRDDVIDHGEGGIPGASARRVEELVSEALQALDSPMLDPCAVAALRVAATGLRLGAA